MEHSFVKHNKQSGQIASQQPPKTKPPLQTHTNTHADSKSYKHAIVVHFVNVYTDASLC